MSLESGRKKTYSIRVNPANPRTSSPSSCCSDTRFATSFSKRFKETLRISDATTSVFPTVCKAAFRTRKANVLSTALIRRTPWGSISTPPPFPVSPLLLLPPPFPPPLLLLLFPWENPKFAKLATSAKAAMNLVSRWNGFWKSISIRLVLRFAVTDLAYFSSWPDSLLASLLARLSAERATLQPLVWYRTAVGLRRFSNTATLKNSSPWGGYQQFGQNRRVG